jgi:hypothetical protein
MVFSKLVIQGFTLSLVVFLFILGDSDIEAQTSFVPPNTVLVEMYPLDGEGNQTRNRCEPGSRVYGCTAYCNDLPDKCSLAKSDGYPFSSSSVIIGFEGFTFNGVEQGYLQNIIPTEVSIDGHHSLTLFAQAIAARSYGSYKQKFYPVVTNSNADQVYIPFQFDALTQSQQDKVTAALTPRHYMSYHTEFFDSIRQITADDPIFSEFSADALERTLSNGEQSTKHPYLLGIRDPISGDPTINCNIWRNCVVDGVKLAHERGLSQNGASRWARGSTSWFQNPPAAAAWSVHWTRIEQILTHYYTGIHLRDANSGNQIVTPPNRWVPLGLAAPTALCANQSGLLHLRLQNTGTSVWEANTVSVLVDSVDVGPSAAPQTTVIPTRLAPGEETVVLVPLHFTTPGQTSYTLDLALGGQRFSAQTPAWPGDSRTLAVIDCAYSSYLPLVQGDASATTLSQ